MRIYLDTSVLNRPFDDQGQPRIALETQALRIIVQAILAEQLILVHSSVVVFELQNNPYAYKKQWVERCMQMATYYQEVDEATEQRAQELERDGVKAIDALHVACAETAKCDYFLTCDDRLIRRYRGTTKAVNPTSFVLIITEADEE
jgi:predicted nucleic acid-binding protein